jgi:HK97 family phage prohead protease
VHFTFNSTITAADAGRRIIAGQIVPFGEVGNTSVGKVVFEPNSINIKAGAKIKLLLEHDRTKPIGILKDAITTQQGIQATFSVADTSRGSDSLIEASQGLRDGLSVGVDVKAAEPRDGILYVTQCSLREVSLVESQAFENATVHSVAASETQPEPETPTPTEETQNTESEASMSEATPEPTENVEAAAADVTPMKIAATAVAFTAPRSPITTAGSYLEHSIKAKLDPYSESALYVKAANDSTSTGVGNIPVIYQNSFASNTTGVRPTIDAMSKGVLPQSGMKFELPKLTTAPTVATTAEVAAPSATGMVTAFLEVPVTKQAGTNTISVELLDRSQPVFWDTLMSELGKALAKDQDTVANAALIAGGTLGGAISTNIFQNFVADAAPKVFAGTAKFADRMIVNSTQWGALLSAVDTTGRPIYTAVNPWNATGSADPQSLRGYVAGLPVYVDPYMSAGTGDNSMIILSSENATWYESPTYQLQLNILSSLEIQVAVYAYSGIAIRYAAGVSLYNAA